MPPSDSVDRAPVAASPRRKRPSTRAVVVLSLGLWLAAAAAVTAQAHALSDAPGDQSAAMAEQDEAYWGAELPWHPKLVHVPIALCILMPPLTIGLLLLVRLGWMDRRSVILAAGLQAMCAASSLAALYTGHEDAVAVEGYASDRAMDAHDARAHQFVYVAAATTALFGLLLYAGWRKQSLQRAAAAAVVAAVMLQGYAGYRVGDAGGRLVYVSNASDAHK